MSCIQSVRAFTCVYICCCVSLVVAGQCRACLCYSTCSFLSAVFRVVLRCLSSFIYFLLLPPLLVSSLCLCLCLSPPGNGRMVAPLCGTFLLPASSASPSRLTSREGCCARRWGWERPWRCVFYPTRIFLFFFCLARWFILRHAQTGEYVVRCSAACFCVCYTAVPCS